MRWSGFLWQGIACQQLDEHEYWLVADMGTRCSNDGVSPYRVLCLALGLAFPVGLPLGFLAMMRSQVRRLLFQPPIDIQLTVRPHSVARIASCLGLRLGFCLRRSA